MTPSRLVPFSISVASYLLFVGCHSQRSIPQNGGSMSNDAKTDSRSGSLTMDTMPTGGVVATGGTSAEVGSFSTLDGGEDTPISVGGAGSNTMGGQPTSGGVTTIDGLNATGGNPSFVDSGPETSSVIDVGGAPLVDKNGIALAKPGDSKNQSRQYLNFGDMRLIVNKWGSDELRCNTSLRVFVDSNQSFGWTFDRGTCGGAKEKPDYPEIEFGIHPFDSNSSLVTTPSFSSTALLPIQIKDLKSASVTLDGLDIKIQKASTYNFNFELWLSQKNPNTDPNPGVHAELITFIGWQDDWACDKSGNVRAGDRGFKLCHQSDSWAGGRWRYFQFRLDSGSTHSFSGKIDIKALLDWLVTNHSYSKDLWITRFEVGSEIDDNTSGTVTLKNIAFEVNGVTKVPEFGEK